MKYEAILKLIKEKLEKHLGVWDDVKEVEIYVRLYIEISDLYIEQLKRGKWNETISNARTG